MKYYTILTKDTVDNKTTRTLFQQKFMCNDKSCVINSSKDN